MISQKRKTELLAGLREAVVTFEVETVEKLSKEVLDEGMDAYDAVMNGLATGMEEVGKLYAMQEYFVPELLMCSDALYAGLDILRPHIKGDQETSQTKRQIVLGTVEGDIHDIGKNLVKIMFEASGWIVHDLGKDVKLERFVEEKQKTNANVVALSALMTTSMLAMPKVIEMLRAKDPIVAVLVGGAPLTREIARRYGADGYADSAATAVKEALDVLDRIGSIKAK